MHSAHLKGAWQSQHKHRKQRKSKDRPTNRKESMQKGCAAAGAQAKEGMAAAGAQEWLRPGPRLRQEWRGDPAPAPFVFASDCPSLAGSGDRNTVT